MKELLIKKIMEEKKDLARKFMVAVAKALDPELGDRAEELVDEVLAEDGDDSWGTTAHKIPVTVHVVKKHAFFDFYDCPVCGSKINLKSKARHENTLKHKQAHDVWETRFDMKRSSKYNMILENSISYYIILYICPNPYHKTVKDI